MHEAILPAKEQIPDISKIQFKVPDLATTEAVDVDDIDTPSATFEGTRLYFLVKYNSWKNKSLTGLTIDANVSTKSIPNAASFTIWITNDEEGCQASTDIEKDRRLEGLGRILWESMLNLIQEIANKHNLSVTHEVRRNPKYPLTVEKWNELFLPLLAEHGYVATDNPAHWRKTYLPQK